MPISRNFLLEFGGRVLLGQDFPLWRRYRVGSLNVFREDDAHLCPPRALAVNSSLPLTPGTASTFVENPR